MFDQVELVVSDPSPSFHVAHSISYFHNYIWSSYSSPKPAKIDYSALFSFDPPSAFLFSFSLVGAVAMMKLFTYFGSKLGLDTVSEEPVNIPTRYLIEQALLYLDPAKRNSPYNHFQPQTSQLTTTFNVQPLTSQLTTTFNVQPLH